MTSRRDRRRRAAERGSAALPFALALPVMIGFMGLPIDLSSMYTRHNELQQFADSPALAAARKLDGTKAGVNLVAIEASIFSANAPYDFRRKYLSWTVSALSFADSVDGPWNSVSEITDLNATSLAYVKVDTKDMSAWTGEAVGAVTTFFPQPLTDSVVRSVSARAVAGAPSSLHCSPSFVSRSFSRPSNWRASCTCGAP
jgi:Flp pilus assembly protein TadG